MHTLLHQFRRAVSVTTDHLVMATAAASSSSSGSTLKFNRLASEKSPYLLQHATNPVDWYPWGEEAFKAAVEQNKLIFLSVGYSTCHWCHVMERESFENPQVAQIMNKHFINIKVDREERPDVDKVYMTFVTSMSGSGGWPMSVWLTPDLHPIYGGTYFPPNNRYFGRPGFTTLLEALAKQWASDEAKVRKSGTDIVSVLQKTAALSKPSEDDTPPGGEVAVKCVAQLARSYEPEYGGFSDSPKFPQPSNLNFLFAYYLLHPSLDDAKTAKDMALHTLTMMARGGIHDHVSQGFARYSTDKSWHVPHFEKMLYDQAQLVHAYLDAYLVTREELYADVVRDVLQYVLRDLSHESGGFYSAEDADSLPASDSTEKKEGAFCVWTHEEVRSLLEGMTVDSREGEQVCVADLFCHHYSVAVAGNVDPYKDPHDELKNQNVLIEHGSLDETAEEFGLAVTTAREALKTALLKLHERRLLRPKPHLDDKMLTAWNGMMLSAVSRAAVVLSEPIYADRAAKAVKFILSHLMVPESGRLYRAAYRGDDTQVTLGPHPTEGFCDDYAWTIRALLMLYESTLDQSHLVRASELQKVQDTLFWDVEDGGYFLTQAGDSSILVRLKDDQDGAEPAVNSVSAGNLLRLGRLLDQQEMLKKCDTILRVYGERLSKIPIALPEMATVMLMRSEPTSQVILSGRPDSPNMKELLYVVHNAPHPNRILLVAPPEEDAPLYHHNPNLLKYRPKPLAEGASTAAGDEESAKAYVCCNFVCSLPMSKPDQLKNNLDQAFKTAAAAK